MKAFFILAAFIFLRAWLLVMASAACFPSMN